MHHKTSNILTVGIATHVEKRVVLASEGHIGQVLSRGGGAHGNGCKRISGWAVSGLPSAQRISGFGRRGIGCGGSLLRQVAIGPADGIAHKLREGA